MNEQLLRQACYNVGLVEPISIEPDGTVWTGVDSDRVYPDMDLVNAEVVRLAQEKLDAKASAEAKLLALGLTVDEIRSVL